MTKLITYRTFRSYIERCVNKEMRENGKAYAGCTVSTKSNCIEGVWSDKKMLEVTDDWHDRVKRAAVYQGDLEKEV